MVLKKISIIVDTEEEDRRLEHFVKRWVVENFQKADQAKIKIEESKDGT